MYICIYTYTLYVIKLKLEDTISWTIETSKHWNVKAVVEEHTVLLTMRFDDKPVNALTMAASGVFDDLPSSILVSASMIMTR